MRLISNWKSGQLFWRTFTKDDTVYIFGLKEGFIVSGETITYENPTGFFQLEIKRGDIFGPTLISAGHVFNNDDEYIISENGELKEIQEAARIIIDTGFREEFYGGLFQFFSQGGADSSIKIVSSISQITTTNNNSQTTITNSATDEKGVQVGGVVTGKVPVKGVEVGVTVTPSISDKVINKIERLVVATLGVQIATTTSYSEEQNITLKAGKLTAIYSTWVRRYVTGTVTLGHDTFHYDATVGYHSSRQVSEYSSPDALGPEAMAAYMEQNPTYLPPVNLVDGKVLRELTKAEVYVIFGGAKFHVPNVDVLKRLYGGWGNVKIVGDNRLGNVPTTPRDGTILKEEIDPHVWLIEQGKRRHITSVNVLNGYGGWATVHVVPNESTSNFQIGNPVV